MAREPVSVRLQPIVKEAAQKAAAADRRTVSQWVETVIIQRLEADGFLPPGAAE